MDNVGNINDLIYIPRAVVLSPWLTVEEDTPDHILEERSEYCDRLEGILSGLMQYEPFYPLMHYKKLPEDYMDKNLTTPYAQLKSCRYYVGKTPCYRNFERWIEVSDGVIVGVDLGVGVDTMKLIRECCTGKKVFYVSIWDIERIGKCYFFRNRVKPLELYVPNVIDLIQALINDRKMLDDALRAPKNMITITKDDINALVDNWENKKDCVMDINIDNV